jgi:hypothetical protein
MINHPGTPLSTPPLTTVFPEILTGSTEAWASGEFGNVDNLCSKLLIRLTMYASAYNGEWSSAKKKEEKFEIKQTERDRKSLMEAILFHLFSYHRRSVNSKLKIDDGNQSN